MEEDRLFKLLDRQNSVEDKLGMIFSNNMDLCGNHGGAISIKKWDDTFKQIIKYFKLKE